MLLERLSRRVTCPNHARSRRMTVQKKFLWVPRDADLARHPVVGLVLQVGDAEKFPQALDLEILHPVFSGAVNQGPCFTAVEGDRGN